MEVRKTLTVELLPLLTQIQMKNHLIDSMHTFIPLKLVYGTTIPNNEKFYKKKEKARSSPGKFWQFPKVLQSPIIGFLNSIQTFGWCVILSNKIGKLANFFGDNFFFV